MLLNFIKTWLSSNKKHNENLHKVHLQVITMHACTALASKVFRTQKIIIKDFYLQSLSPLKKLLHTHRVSWETWSFLGFVFLFFIIIAINERQQRIWLQWNENKRVDDAWWRDVWNAFRFWTVSVNKNCNVSTETFQTSNLS